MAKKYVMLILVCIVMLFFAGSKVTADEITGYSYMDPQESLADNRRTVQIGKGTGIRTCEKDGTDA